jgi:hypothetical protein
VIGDSLAGPLGIEMGYRARSTGVVATIVDNRGGSGLVSAGYFDWPAHVAARATEVAPEVIVVHLGANDGAPIRVSGGVLEVGSPEWMEAYESLVTAFMDQVAAAADDVYWVGLPPMLSPSYDARVRRFNALYARLAAERPRVRYVPSYGLLAVGGAFAAVLPGADGSRRTVRDPDGVHYTAGGADLLAAHVLEVIGADWGFGDLLP